MRSILISLALIVLAALPARAADDVLRLRSGKMAVGKITALDDKGVTIQTASGGEARYDWAALTPLCQYEVRADHLEVGDAAGHVALAKFCLKNGLYAHARSELATAEGLEYPDADELGELVETVDQAEADEIFARVEQLMGEEEYEKAVEEIRRYKMQAPESEHTRKATAMLPDLFRRIDQRKLREEEEQKEAALAEKNRRLAEKIQKLLDAVEESRQEASDAFTEAVRYHVKGNVTRAKKNYLTAEKALFKAHNTLKKVQRTARHGVAFEKAKEEMKEIRRRLTDVYLGLARMYVADRNYKRGTVYVNKALYLDPVNQEALALRQEIDANRIRRRASDVTNTVPGRGK